MTNVLVLGGLGNDELTQAVAEALGVPLGHRMIEPFPDGELHVEIEESVRGRDVYLIQSTDAPVADHLLALLLTADAARRAGARMVTAVIPYFGYARQERRAHGREPVGARVIADLLEASSVQRVVAIDLHTGSLEGFFTVPLEHLTAVPLLIEAVRASIRRESVVISPDLGAVKLAERYARALDLPVAVVQKTRLSGLDVRAGSLVGDVRGLAPIVVDDMISTAGTVEAAVHAALQAGAIPEVTVVASHGLFVGPARERLDALPIRKVVVTDSVAQHEANLPVHVVGLGGLIADAIRRLASGQSLSDLLEHG